METELLEVQSKSTRGKNHIKYKGNILLTEGGQAKEQVVQGDCIISILMDTQSSAALGSEQLNTTSQPPL